MAEWTHRSCERCFINRQIDAQDDGDQWVTIKIPVLLNQQVMVESNEAVGECCFCGLPTVIGLYVRADPSTVQCVHEEEGA